MTGDGDPANTPPRRRFLAGAATALAATTAGCGYVPGGGDLTWREPLRVGSLAFDSDRWHLATDDRLVVVENQSGRTYDWEDEEWGEVENAAVSVLEPDGTVRSAGETERQAVGSPAVGGGAVFVPVERGRVTAVDLSRDESAGGSPAEGGTTGGGATDGPDDDAVRWRVDFASVSGGGESETSGPALGGVRASGALAVAVGSRGIAAVDAETGDRAFAVSDLWTDGSGREPADLTLRVAVDGETVWALVPGIAAATGDGNADAAIVGYDRGGNRRAERAVDAGHEWIAVVDGTVVAGAPGASMSGYDPDLDRRFTLDVRAPNARSTAVQAGRGRLYYSRGRTVASVDVARGEVAFEQSDLPQGNLAVDERGAYVAGIGRERDAGTEARMAAVGVGGAVRWEAPFPDGVEPRELYAFGGRLVALDGDTAYGFRAVPGDRWSPLG
ncbi:MULTISPECIES: PQQ-binding-like beta-propeller repeat protein [Halorubrum]|uniref:Uncharacterized protein n=1 Tax=Halorubrum hochstenium ATCC 700873 TaxID=1227481 RepID=M0EY21_9EURY|nr:MULTISPECIES: PQQ-binding-like beta-propeller repeat protein [Halorubrum]ELZ52605.1 hypothetical protein C467_14364 [Halorubrum hochstenium ATCC 700873]